MALTRFSPSLLVILAGCAGAAPSIDTPPPLMDRPLAERIAKSRFPEAYRRAAREVGKDRWLTIPMTVCSSPTLGAQCDEQWPEGTKIKIDDVFENAITGYSYYYHVTTSDGHDGYIHEHELIGSVEKDPAMVAAAACKRHGECGGAGGKK